MDATGTSTLACELKSNSETGTVAWDGDTTTLTGGQTFWVKNSTAKTLASGASFIRALASGDTTSSDDTADTILFCGQERTRATLSRPDSGMKLLQNDGAEAVTLANIVSSPVAGDTILTIQNGKKNYMYYTYDGDQWIKNSKPKEDISAVTILPGEAFYYNSFTAE